MIRSRNSEIHLSKEMILARISEVDIFAYYCSSFKQLGKPFCSELRKDSNPGVNIVLWKGKLLYKDWAYPEHTFDCFGYVMAAYNVSFYSALRIIDTDFGLNLGSRKEEIDFTRGYLGYRSNIRVENKKDA